MTLAGEKRSMPDEEKTEAAILNRKVLRRLATALDADPGANLLDCFPSNYRSRLDRGREITQSPAGLCEKQRPDSTCDKYPLPTEPTHVVHPLSGIVKNILGVDASVDPQNGIRLTQSLSHVVTKSGTIWQSVPARRCVLQCGWGLVIKIIPSTQDLTEYTTLQYLEHHKPFFPAPRPHGVLVNGDRAFLFMSLMPGTSLTRVWPSLQSCHKANIRDQLDKLFVDLRQMVCPEGKPLGGVAGEGCKDTRRHTKSSQYPIYDSVEFWEFQYSQVRWSGPVFIDFLRQLTRPLLAQRCVFTHGDVRSDNVIVQRQRDGNYEIKGIIDWEMSGFYPEDFECTKITNTLSTDDRNDWYHYLPPCISPERHPLKWLSDRVYDPYVV